jgi:hypothetical protein
MRWFGMAVALGLAGTAVGGEDLNVAAAAATPARPAAGAKPSAATLVTVLDTRSVWHSYAVLKLPLIQHDDGLKPMRTNVSWLNHDGEILPATWKNPNFVDGSWLRGTIPETCQAPLVGRLYLRGRFEVTDPVSLSIIPYSFPARELRSVMLGGIWSTIGLFCQRYTRRAA